jgi:hypothetical protein
MMPIPAAFTNFDVAASEVTVWLLRKSGGAQGAAPTFTARWIAANPELEGALKAAVADERNRIQEVAEYSLLAENNEASALSIGTLETHADLILEKTANPLPARMATQEELCRADPTTRFEPRWKSVSRSYACIKGDDEKCVSTPSVSRETLRRY